MMSFLKSILLIIILIQSIAGQDPDKRCNGTNAFELPDYCVIIETTKLIFTEYDDEDAMFDKMSKVIRIENGVEVIGTTLENFDYLSNVEVIKNPDGPALIFRDNRNLKRIMMEKLKMLNGKEEDVLLDRDGFPVASFEDPGALKDMLHLEAASRAVRRSEKCSDTFIKIVPIEHSGYGWLLYLLISLCVVITGFVGYQTFRILKLKGTIGKKSRNEETKPNGRDERGGTAKRKKVSKNK